MADDDIIEGDGSVADSGDSMFGATSEDTSTDVIDDDTRAALDQIALDQYEQSRGFGDSWEFDFEARRFVLRGNEVAQTTEKDTLSQWCMNVLATERFTALVYSDDIGIEAEDVIQGVVPSHSAIAVLKQRVTEALMIHDRIEGIRDFAGDLNDGRTILVSFTVDTTAGSIAVTGEVGS